MLEMESGAMATIDTAWCANGEEFAIHGTLGRVLYRNASALDVASTEGAFDGRVIHYSGGTVPAFGGPTGVEQRQDVKAPAFGDVANPLNQHRLFLEAISANQPAPVSIDSGLEDMRVVEAVYESARTGKEQTVQRPFTL